MIVSVIVPCYNEEAVIRETHRSLVAVLEQLEDLKHELIYVDDGSRDQTAEILQDLQAGDEHVQVVLLSRNFVIRLRSPPG